MKIKPCMDQVCIEVLDLAGTKTKGGIIIVASKPNSLPTEKGTVVAVGPGKWESGKFVETVLKVGQKVAYHEFPSGVDLEEDGKKYKVVAEKQVVCVLGD